MENFIIRKQYLNQLISFKDKDVIKVVSGIRRSGKSTLFEIYKNYLLENNIEREQIIHVNLESPDFFEIDDYKKLYNHIKAKLIENKKCYIFIDEVQNIPDFQKTVDGLYIDKNCDIYITGSNAFLLSGELATLLFGRYVEIKMLTFSFAEFLQAQKDKSDLIIKYQNYITYGSFPYITKLDTPSDKYAYLEGIYSSILLKDVVSRYKITDTKMLESVIEFLFDNIGNLCSSSKIANTMTSSGRKITNKTVETYISALCNSFILHKTSRYDVKGKEHLTTGQKYYLADIGLRYYLLGSKPADMGHILENIVYLELRRRGYKVFVGKMDRYEIDFVAIGEKGTEYYQVAYSVIESETLKRELTPLEGMKDHNQKFLITMDFTPNCSHNGIKQINALDWLLEK